MTRHLAFLALALLTTFAPATLAETPTQAEAAGLDADRLERIDQHFEQRIAEGEMIGGQALIWRKGTLAYESTWGMRDREKGLPVEEDTLFRIYSMSKPITSVAVMMLFEEGHFGLADPVGNYLPELADLEVWMEGADPETGEPTAGPEPSPRPVTIRDLLRHSSGFSYGLFSRTPVDEMYVENNILLEANIAELVSDLSELPLLYTPGTRWHYGVSTDVLGRLVEVVSGKSFGEFLEERLFAPLGMKDTRFRLREGEDERLAKLYARVQDEEGKTAFVDAPPEWSAHIGPDGTFESGGGGLLGTAHDYLRFCRMLLNGGELDGQRILSRKTVELMASDHTSTLEAPYPFPGFGFGLGFAVVLHPGTAGELGSPGAYRWAGAAGTGFFIDPAEEMVAVFMTQFLDSQGGQLRKEMRRLAYQAIDD